MQMASKVTLTDRERDIASQIRNACVSTTATVDEINKHKDDVEKLDDGLTSDKLIIMAQVAKMSSVGKWLPGEILHATAYAANMGNVNPDDPRSAKSLSTFMSEMNAVAHPKVRDRFPVILGAVKAAWAAEKAALAADKSIPAPVKKWASREYHAISQAMRAVKNDDANFTCADDVVLWAAQHDPDFNPERVANRLKTLADALQTVFVNFANEDIGRAQAYVQSVSAEQLIESRKIKLAKEHKAKQEHKLMSVKAQVEAPRGQATTPAIEAAEQAPSIVMVEEEYEHEPMEGAFDPLDDMLNDHNQARMIEELAA